MSHGIVIILMLMLFKNRDNNVPNLLDNTFKPIDLDVSITMEKIQLIKKIGPYFPEEIIPSINKALMVTEKIIKLYQTIEFIQFSEANYIQNTIPVENNQERLSYIAQTIKKEFSKEEINKMGTSIEMVLTIDRFNKLFIILNSIMTNPDHIKDPTNIIKLMEPLMDGKDEKEIKQIKDITKMLEILQTLDSPKKSTEKKEDN
ncbi:hypothetical protein [Clostridium sp. Cult2]|uniref:hypothetical protein n=1 Tax=Clostridium sp. Cult2 TaxID=2079003 RepID=UPI001F3BE1F3|nr:hypothetical protein [Clostridium sp. Cult2]MCF6466697.1 hypothetical protein [Clostridium sp. Cult2]